MNLLLNLLKAFGIALGWYLVLFSGIWAMLSIHLGEVVRFRDLGLKDMPPSEGALFTDYAIFLPGVFLMLLLLASPFFVALYALYLPPQDRFYVAIGALSLIVAIWTYVGIQLFNAPRY